MKTTDAESSDKKHGPVGSIGSGDAFGPGGPENRLTDDLIIRYWLGEASPSENEALENLFTENPTLRQRSADLFDGIKASGYSIDRVTTAVRTAHIVNLVKTSEDRLSTRKYSSDSKIPFGLRIGSVFAIVATLVLGFWFGKAPSTSDDIEQYHAFVTKAGEQSTINLSDGSSVTINVASRVLVPIDYAEGNRNIVLEGEALFHVESHSTSPFTVTSGPTVTRVLGTTFSIRRYANDTVTSVAVRDGRVGVDTAVVSASQQLLVFDGRALGESSIDGANVKGGTDRYRIEPLNSKKFEFANGILAFDNIALVDAIPELERWYDVEIKLIHPELRNEKIDGGFKVGSQASLVSILELTFNVQVIQKGRVINVYRRHS